MKDDKKNPQQPQDFQQVEPAELPEIELLDIAGGRGNACTTAPPCD